MLIRGAEIGIDRSRIVDLRIERTASLRSPIEHRPHAR
jgi:hypothetical protein